MALASVSASAYDFVVDSMYYNVVSISDLTCEVTSGDVKYKGNVKIPSTVEYSGRTFSVIGIGCAFQYCSDLTSVDIPSSVTSIGKNAFSGCKSLTSVDIPNSVTSIGEYAFDNSGLTSIVFPNSVTAISNSVFSRCYKLASIVIPNSVTSIGEYAFSSCNNLTSIDIPNSVTSIGYAAFSSCMSLTSVSFPNSLTSIGSYAFFQCPLSKLKVGNSYTIKSMLSRAQTLIISEDYSDTDLPNISYSEYTGLDTIVCNLQTPPVLYNTFSDSQILKLVVIVPTESLTTYQAADVWKNFMGLKGGAENYGFTTGINTITIDTNKPTTIYDINGHKLNAPKKGLNIINGKKVFVK